MQNKIVLIAKQIGFQCKTKNLFSMQNKFSHKCKTKLTANIVSRLRELMSNDVTRMITAIFS